MAHPLPLNHVTRVKVAVQNIEQDSILVIEKLYHLTGSFSKSVIDSLDHQTSKDLSTSTALTAPIITIYNALQEILDP
jgi:hypothetical protein